MLTRKLIKTVLELIVVQLKFLGGSTVYVVVYCSWGQTALNLLNCPIYINTFRAVSVTWLANGAAVFI